MLGRAVSWWGATTILVIGHVVVAWKITYRHYDIIRVREMKAWEGAEGQVLYKEEDAAMGMLVKI